MSEEKKQNGTTNDELVESVKQELVAQMEGNVANLSASCTNTMLSINHIIGQFINSVFNCMTEEDKCRLINIALSNMESDMMTKKYSAIRGDECDG